MRRDSGGFAVTWDCNQACRALCADSPECEARIRNVRLAPILILGLAGCQYFPTAPAIDCGQVPPDECTRMVNDLMEQARSEFPDKRVQSIRLSTPTGGYDVVFTDGTGFAVTH